MNIPTIELKKLIASDGMTFTNGEAFGKTVYLANGAYSEDWWEVTDEEAERLQREAEEADYIAALERFGVKNDEG